MLDSLTERYLAAVAVALGARSVSGFSSLEESLAANLPTVERALVRKVRGRIKKGYDPLGAYFTKLRSAEVRRPLGATYTPTPIVRAMVGGRARTTRNLHAYLIPESAPLDSFSPLEDVFNPQRWSALKSIHSQH